MAKTKRKTEREIVELLQTEMDEAIKKMNKDFLDSIDNYFAKTLVGLDGFVKDPIKAQKSGKHK